MVRGISSILVGAGTLMTLALSACGNGPPPVQSGSAGGASSGGSPGGAAVQVVNSGPGVTTVKETDDLKFVPASISVKSGDIVEWDNIGTTPHNVTFDAGAASQTMNGGDKFYAKFTRPGTYQYHCTFHAPGMAGTITVT